MYSILKKTITQDFWSFSVCRLQAVFENTAYPNTKHTITVKANAFAMEKDIWEQLTTALRFLDCTRVGKGVYSLSLKSASFSLACCCVTGLLPGLSQSHLNNFHFYCQSGGEKKKNPQKTNQWWKVFCCGFAVSKIAARVCRKQS